MPFQRRIIPWRPLLILYRIRLSSAESGKQYGVQSFNSIGENKASMLSSFNGLLLVHPRYYEFTLSICRGDDRSQASGSGEEHDARDILRILQKTIRENILEQGDPRAVGRKFMKHELKAPSRAALFRQMMSHMLLILTLVEKIIKMENLSSKFP